MLLSIIIPVYNVEAYVGETLDSVFDTAASTEAFEVIVVNDGTEDGSMDVVLRYASKPNLKIIEQGNQGLSAARLRGLSAAEGDYVWFIDSDDYLVEDGVGIVLGLLADRPGAEVLMFPLMYIYENGTGKDRLNYSLDKELVTDGRTIVQDLHFDVVGSQRYIIQRGLFSNPHLSFPVGLLFEDVYFGAALVSVVKSFHVFPFHVYNYRVRKGSIMTSLKVQSGYDMVAIHKMVMKIKEQALDPSDWPWFERYFYQQLANSYLRLASLYGTPDFRRFVRSHGHYVWRNWVKVHPDSSWKTKVKRLLFFMMPERFGHYCG